MIAPMNRRRALAAVAGLCLTVVACGGDDSDDATAPSDAPAAADSTSGGETVGTGGPSGTYRYGGGADLMTFDAHRSQSGQAFSSYMTLVYDGLVHVDENFEVQPALAESWEWVDPTHLNLVLREGVTFSDGTPFDAAAAKANLERALAAEGPRVNLIGRIDSIAAPDSTHLELTLSRPDAILLQSLGSSPGMMISPAAFDNPDLDRNPVGTGPYVYDAAASTPGSEYVFTAREGYYEPAYQHAAEIHVLPIADNTARFNALRSGQVDLALISPSEADTAKSEGFELLEAPNRWDGMTIIDRNGTLVPAFADVRVRQAIGYAVDRDALIDAVYLGYAEPTAQPFTEGEPGHDAALDDFYSYDPDRARELLAEAGYADGFSFTYPTQESMSTAATAIQGYLAAVGIDMRIEMQESGSLGAVARTTDYPVIGFGYPARDPDSRAQAIWSSTAGFNPFKVEVPELDELAAAASEANDEAARDELFRQYAEIVVSEGISVIFATPLDLVAHSDAVAAVSMTGFYDPFLRSITVTE